MSWTWLVAFVVALTMGQMKQICKSAGPDYFDLLYFQVDETIRVRRENMLVPAKVFPTLSSATGMNQSIAVGPCSCPELGSYGCAAIGGLNGVASGWRVAVPTSTVAFGGTVQFMLNSQGNTFELKVQIPFASETVGFLPLLSMGTQVGVRLAFPESLLTEQRGAWSFGVCQKRDGSFSFHLCFIAKPDERTVVGRSLHFVLDGTATLDLTQDIVTFFVSKDEKNFNSALGVVHAKITRNQTVIFSGQIKPGIPELSATSIMRIGYQSEVGIASYFDSFWAANSTAFSHSRLLAAGWENYFCVDLFTENGTRCKRDVDVILTRMTATMTVPVTIATRTSDPTSSGSTSDSTSISVVTSDSTSMSVVPSDSTTDSITKSTPMSTTTRSRDNLAGTTVGANLKSDVSNLPTDWTAVGLFIAAGVLMVIGAVFVWMLLNRRN